jgi:ribosomal protein S18 acetylase RimI-like enzyme
MPPLLRPATRDDLPALGRLGARLMHLHHEFDRRRFLEPMPDAEQGYAWFLGTQLDEPEARVVVAEEDGQVVGYAYGAIEPRSWQMLLDEAGMIHDVMVDHAARGRGIGTSLVNDMLAWMRTRGVPRVVLHTADPNAEAQRLFQRLGFRPTMIEMTRELGE